MKLVKSLLLGSAAGIAAVAGAQAADLPSRKAAPVEYVRVCSTWGAGFFYIPGTDTCLRVGGRVRAEYTFGERWSERQDPYGTRARGRIYIDARNATAYGTLRTFVRYDVTTSTGSYRYGGLNAGANPYATTNRNIQDNNAVLDSAFVQLGPLSAGKMQSWFSFYANDQNFSSVRTSDRQVNVLAYTATFGGGFSATLSLEDPSTASTTLGAGTGQTYKGMTHPDVVANVRVDQGWGSAQLSGALTNRGTSTVGTIATNRDEWGFAIQGGVKINLPMLAAGDHIWLQGAYAQGALGYLGHSGAIGFGRLGQQAVFGDYTVNTVTARTKANTGFSIVAGLRHFWLPNLRTDIIGSYSEIDIARTNFTATGGGLDPKELIVAGNLVWTPVSGLDIGVEVLYSRAEYKYRVVDVKNAARTIKSDDAWAGRLRIQRDF